MTSRREARRQAIDVLYQADVTEKDPRIVLAEWRSAGREIDPFAEELVDGVAANRAEIDSILLSHVENWSLERMATLDRNILRVAVFELLHRPETPASVAISEAVEIAKRLSTEDSSRFVNGILGTFARESAVEDPAESE
jgi:N utilization substance protein B